MTYFKFEFNKLKRHIKGVLIWTAVVQLSGLYFFALVGRFDQGDSDHLLTQYPAVIGLASTVTMCIIGVYGAIISSKSVIRDYIGQNKIRIFLLPVRRRTLLVNKLLALVVLLVLGEFLGVLISDTIFTMSELIQPLVGDRLLPHILTFLQASFVSTGMMVSVVLFASLFGVWRSSAVSTIVAGVTLVILVSNMMAMLLISSGLSAVLITGIVLTLGMVSCQIMGNAIEKKEVS